MQHHAVERDIILHLDFKSIGCLCKIMFRKEMYIREAAAAKLRKVGKRNSAEEYDSEEWDIFAEYINLPPFAKSSPMTDSARMASPSSSQSEKSSPMFPPSRIPPVFVFPSTIEFFEDDPTTHKRVLTIYNPYDYEVAFKGADIYN